MAHHLEHKSLQWRHNGCDSVSNHQPHDCLLNRLFRRRSKKTSKLRVTGLCAGNSSGTSEFHAQMASYAENVSIWWRYHVRDRSVRVFGASIWNKLGKCMLRYRFIKMFLKKAHYFSRYNVCIWWMQTQSDVLVMSWPRKPFCLVRCLTCSWIRTCL